MGTKVMLRDDLDRIRSEVEAKQRLLSKKKKDLSRIQGQLEAPEEYNNRITLEKTRERLLYEIPLLEQAMRSAAEEYAKERSRLERVIAIKGKGSLPPPLNLDGAFALSSKPFLPEPAVDAPPPAQPTPTGAPAEQNEISGTAHFVRVPKYSGAAKWQNIEIVFLGDLRVQMRINGKQTEPVNYAELGFADGRSENPNKAWLALRLLAEHRGILKDESEVGEPWRKVEKRIQEIRKALRELFGIPDDPLPFVEGAGYQAVFKIRCGPSFHA